MERDYSHIQGSDYAYVPERPQQPNLIQGLGMALEGFRKAKEGIELKKEQKAEAKTEKERQRLQGELKAKRDEEDRQLSRKEKQANIGYKNKQTSLLGTDKKGTGKSGSGASGEKTTYSYKDNRKRYEKLFDDITSLETDDTKMMSANAPATLRAMKKEAMSKLGAIVENGDKLDVAQQEFYDKFYPEFWDETGRPIRYAGDYSEEENLAYEAKMKGENQPLQGQGEEGQAQPVPSEETKIQSQAKSLPIANLGGATLKNYQKMANSKLLGTTPFEQYQGMMKGGGVAIPDFSKAPEEGPLRDANMNVASLPEEVAPVSKLDIALKDAKGVASEVAGDAVKNISQSLTNTYEAASDTVKGGTTQLFGPAALALAGLVSVGKSGYNKVAYGDSQATSWVKENGSEGAEQIKVAIGNPADNRKALLKMRDEMELFGKLLTPEGKEAFNSALKEAGIDKVEFKGETSDPMEDAFDSTSDDENPKKTRMNLFGKMPKGRDYSGAGKSSMIDFSRFRE